MPSFFLFCFHQVTWGGWSEYFPPFFSPFFFLSYDQTSKILLMFASTRWPGESSGLFLSGTLSTPLLSSASSGLLSSHRIVVKIIKTQLECAQKFKSKCKNGFLQQLSSPGPPSLCAHIQVFFKTPVFYSPFHGTIFAKTRKTTEIIVLQLSHLIFGVKYLLDNLQLAPF